MDLHLDKPIDSVASDILGFQQLAEGLIDVIKSQRNSVSLTLGLDGAWGTGKSSILGMLSELLSDSHRDECLGTVLVPFSPWLITNRTALVTSFFAQISVAILEAKRRIPKDWRDHKKEVVQAFEKARAQLGTFSKGVSLASTVACAFDPSLVSAAVVGSAKALESFSAKASEKTKTLETLKSELSASLGKIAKADPSFRILVLIDDLDRLDPEDALEVLRLVKAVGDFPATTYLLAYDRHVIARAIEQSVNVEDGELYLDKIVQFSFKVPPLEPFQLRRWFKAELENLFPGVIDYEATHSSAVLDIWAGRLLKTPRDVRRLIFAVNALWSRLKGRVDLVDLIWLQMVAQKASEKERDLYSWVEEYLQSLEALAIGATVTGMEKSEEKLSAILNKLGWSESRVDGGEVDLHCLDELLAGITSSFLGQQDHGWTYEAKKSSFDSFRERMRLSSPWHWRLYFALDNPSHAVTDVEWKALNEASGRSSEDLSDALVAVLDFHRDRRPDAADQIIERAMHALQRGKLEHPGRWLVAFVAQVAAMQDQSKINAFSLSRVFDASFPAFARRAFLELPRSERRALVGEIFKKKESICAAAPLVREQYLLSERSEGERKGKLYLTDAELAEAIKSQLAFYRELNPSEFRQLSEPWDILFSWRDLSGSATEPQKFLTSALEGEAGLVETLSALKLPRGSVVGSPASIPERYLVHFVSVSRVTARLKRIAGSDSKYSPEADELLRGWRKDED